MKLSGDRNQCRGCGKYFNSTGAFDRHRVGKHDAGGRKCLSEAEMLGRGMVLRDDGFWRGREMLRSAMVRKGIIA
jgi:hypothetical protein